MPVRTPLQPGTTSGARDDAPAPRSGGPMSVDQAALGVDLVGALRQLGTSLGSLIGALGGAGRLGSAPTTTTGGGTKPTTEVEHTVAAGDTLTSIADRAGVDDWHAIYELNKELIGTDPNRIEPGMKLRLPDGASRPVPADDTKPVAGPSSAGDANASGDAAVNGDKAAPAPGNDDQDAGSTAPEPVGNQDDGGEAPVGDPTNATGDAADEPAPAAEADVPASEPTPDAAPAEPPKPAGPTVYPEGFVGPIPPGAIRSGTSIVQNAQGKNYVKTVDESGETTYEKTATEELASAEGSAPPPMDVHAPEILTQ